MAISHTPHIPEYITVHLGEPDQSAANVEVPFPEYIKNAASCAVYPTWPENALRAIISAIVSSALNRIYTEWYRNQGYNFDITNLQELDQAYVWGGATFDNINRIVDSGFNDYIYKQNKTEPFLAQLCHDASGAGLSPLGAAALAEQGLTPVDILKHYYGDDIEIAQNVPIGQSASAYHDTTLRLGAVGKPVRILQARMNRVGNSYPTIPKITPIDGHFLRNTRDAVAEFQRIFHLTPDGVAGRATWLRLNYIFNALKI